MKRYDKKWARHCSIQCKNSDASSKGLEKRKKSCLEKYGTENPMQSTLVKSKLKETCRRKYGADSPFESVEIRGKIKTSLLEKHGVDNPMKSESIRRKAAGTTKERYGVENPSQNAGIKLKKKVKCLSNYGVENPSFSKEVLMKTKKTKENLGLVIPSHLLTEKEIYYREVDRLTETTYKRYKSTINPMGMKRGRYEFHLDHRISKFDGFLQGLSPEVISHQNNLQMISWKDNLKKHMQSSLRVHELIESLLTTL
jgi:hypothetical protein